jgi:hypothetical protein
MIAHLADLWARHRASKQFRSERLTHGHDAWTRGMGTKHVLETRACAPFSSAGVTRAPAEWRR